MTKHGIGRRWFQVGKVGEVVMQEGAIGQGMQSAEIRADSLVRVRNRSSGASAKKPSSQNMPKDANMCQYAKMPQPKPKPALVLVGPLLSSPPAAIPNDFQFPIPRSTVSKIRSSN